MRMSTTTTNRQCDRIPLALWRLVFKNVLHHNTDSNNNNNNMNRSNATLIFHILRNATADSGSLLVLERRLAPMP